MWKSVARFFKHTEDTPDPTQPLRVVAAILLVEAMRADRVVRLAERETIQQDLAQWFELDPLTVHTTEERIEVIERMWRVAFADHHLEPEEEAVIREAATLGARRPQRRHLRQTSRA